MDYYHSKQYIAQVDSDDNIGEKIERWQAHEQGILHRGFTVILLYEQQFVLQHRKHPAFDGFYDLTFSSHQRYKNNVLQKDEEAILETLEREWNIDITGIKEKPLSIGKIYYKAKDPKSIYTEHEIDYIYMAKLIDRPNPTKDFAYGFETATKQTLHDFNLAPWVDIIVQNGLL